MKATTTLRSRAGQLIPRAPDGPLGAAADRAKALLGASPGATQARRTLPIFATPEELAEAWHQESTRQAVLDGIPVEVEALAMTFGPGRPGWGNAARLEVELDAPLPHLAADALAGKILRRFKSLVETGEVPTTKHNPSGRNDDPADHGQDGGAR